MPVLAPCGPYATPLRCNRHAKCTLCGVHYPHVCMLVRVLQIGPTEFIPKSHIQFDVESKHVFGPFALIYSFALL